MTASKEQCPQQPGKTFDRFMSEWYCDKGVRFDFDCTWYMADDPNKCAHTTFKCQYSS